MYTLDMNELAAGDSLLFSDSRIRNDEKQYQFPKDIVACQIDMLAGKRLDDTAPRVPLATMCFRDGGVSTGACPADVISR